MDRDPPPMNLRHYNNGKESLARRMIARRMEGVPADQVVRETTGRHFSPDEAKAIGTSIGVSWDEFSLEEFRKGLEVEWEHAKTVDYDLGTIGRIVQDHLKENPIYYSEMGNCDL